MTSLPGALIEMLLCSEVFLKLNTLSTFIILSVLLLSFVLMPFSNAEAKGEKQSRSVASTKLHQANKKSSFVKKKKSQVAKQQKPSKKKTYGVATKSKKQVVKKSPGHTTSTVIVPELEIVMPEGNFHNDYGTSIGSTEMTSQQTADEF